MSPEDKIGLLREHLEGGIPISLLSSREGIESYEIQRWKQILFEKGTCVFVEEVVVPPGVRYEFDDFVAQVCDRARADSSTRSESARNLINGLEQTWQSAVVAGASTEAATRRAYERFGSVEEAAGILRQPLWVRVLMYGDHRPHRMLACLLFAMLLTISMYAGTWFESHYMNSTIALSSGLMVFNSIFAILPLLPFTLREESTVRYIRNRVRPEAERISRLGWPAKRLLATATIIPLCLPIVSAYSRVPYQIAGASDWRIGALMTIGAWGLTRAAPPALACLLAEAFLHPGVGSQAARHLLTRIARNSERGTWLVPQGRERSRW